MIAASGLRQRSLKIDVNTKKLRQREKKASQDQTVTASIQRLVHRRSGTDALPPSSRRRAEGLMNQG